MDTEPANITARFDARQADASDERRLLAFLEDRDVSCPLCGYNLRDLTRPECPECRQALFLTVGVQRPRVGWLIVAIAPSIFSGIAAVILSFGLIAAVLTGDRPPALVVIIDLFGWASGLAGIALYASRISFLKRPANMQYGVAIMTWLLHIGMFVLFVVRAA